MKKTLLILIFILTGFSAAWSDTVLFCISDNRTDENVSPWIESVMRSFEDGVMDALFESGHIVTNSFLNECRKLSGDGAVANSEVARIMGNRLGADCVMILELFFSEDGRTDSDTLAVPLKARYALYTNTGKTLSAEEESILKIAAEKGEEELLDSFTVIGRSIAMALSKKL